MLKLAADVTEPNRDLTFIFYEAEEVDSVHNGLRKLTESDPDLMEADFAILMEPSNAVVEAGCQGTMRVDVRTTGERSHSARSWKGVNAIHKAAPVLAPAQRLRRPPARDRRAGLPRGPQRHRHPRRRRRQRDPRRVRRRGQLPLRARPQRGGRRGVRPRLLRGLRRHRHRHGAPARCRASTGPRRRPSSRPSAARSHPKFGWTDVAQFTKLGVPGRQLRTRRPDVRPQAGRARAGRAHRALRAQLRTWLGERRGRSRHEGPDARARS